MIVRISGEDQYRLADERRGAAERARQRRRRGRARAATRTASPTPSPRCSTTCAPTATRVGDDELEGSDLILPPADLTLAEAGAEFTGEGLIPD